MKKNNLSLLNYEKQKIPLKGETTPENAFVKSNFFANMEAGIFEEGFIKLNRIDDKAQK